MSWYGAARGCVAESAHPSPNGGTANQADEHLVDELMEDGTLLSRQRRQDVVEQFGASSDDTIGLLTAGTGEFDHRHAAVGG